MRASEPHWEALADGRFVVQRCRSCEALRWPPLEGCPECLSREAAWVDVEPVGTVWSFVVYHRAFQAALKDQVPYAVAMVQLDAGPYVVGRLVEGEGSVAVGDRVVGDHEGTPDGSPIRWRRQR